MESVHHWFTVQQRRKTLQHRYVITRERDVIDTTMFKWNMDSREQNGFVRKDNKTSEFTADSVLRKIIWIEACLHKILPLTLDGNIWIFHTQRFLDIPDRESFELISEFYSWKHFFKGRTRNSLSLSLTSNPFRRHVIETRDPIEKIPYADIFGPRVATESFPI